MVSLRFGVGGKLGPGRERQTDRQTDRLGEACQSGMGWFSFLHGGGLCSSLLLFLAHITCI